MDEAQAVADLVNTYDGVKKATDFAVAYTQAALDAIDQRSDKPSRKKIRSLAALLLQRAY